MNTVEMIKVMQHYENGGVIEYSNRESNIWTMRLPNMGLEYF